MEHTKAVQGDDGAAELEQAVERFEQWRRARLRGEHIPPVLWSQAVSLSTRHGTHRVAEALGVNADRLLRRVREAGELGAVALGEQRPPAAAAQFVQMVVAAPEDGGQAVTPPAAQPATPPTCVLELRNARGATLRMELPAQALSILPGLCAAFVGA
jgi:hypothetical protein